MTDTARENAKLAEDRRDRQQQEQDRLRRVAAGEIEAQQRGRDAQTVRALRSEIAETKQEMAKGRSLGHRLGRLRSRHRELMDGDGG